ncbi:uncharacterized protein LOC124141619 [Haliotis rufescens]|uniref:uncharacterized protein LOC124141619 n=1 Tax=Haliotis rufescens TaxID=6454 RepID=UPI00201F4579|nr:uncharacterized protein LOC124141619 [Haliotis rufescens]
MLNHLGDTLCNPPRPPDPTVELKPSFLLTQEEKEGVGTELAEVGQSSLNHLGDTLGNPPRPPDTTFEEKPEFPFTQKEAEVLGTGMAGSAPWTADPTMLSQLGLPNSSIKQVGYYTDGETGLPMINISTLTHRASIMITLEIEGCSTEAVIDSGVEMTVISDKLFCKLTDQPPTVQEVVLKNAGRHLKMKGFITDMTRIRIQGKIYRLPICVAPIEDDMLLGADFSLCHYNSINLEEQVLVVGGMEVPMMIKSRRGPAVCGIRLASKTSIPPNSVRMVQCALPKALRQYMTEPDETILGKVLIPRILHGPGKEPIICMVNPTESTVKLSEGQEVGLASEVEEINPDEDPQGQGWSENTHQEEGDTDSETDYESVTSTPYPNLPLHLEDLYHRFSTHLKLPDRRKLAELLIEFQDVFARDELDLGNFTALEHTIDTGNAKPIKQRMRRTPLGFAEEEEAHLTKMLKAGVIQPSTSEWAAAPVLIRKSDGGVHWCVDYRSLNSVCSKDVFPLRLIDECLDTLADSQWFSKLDAKKTAFVTKYGLFEHARMGFGLCNAPATYARVMSLILSGLSWDIVLRFLDDAVVNGPGIPGHFVNLRAVLERFRKYNLKLKPKKCVLFQRKIEFLGRIISPGQIQINEEDLKVVKDWPIPRTTREVESFLGLANYHRVFIKDYAKMAVPLSNIMGKKPFDWGSEQQEAFEELKEALMSPPVLGLTRNTGRFILDTDASQYAIGAELIQVQDEKERTISYGSFALSPEQRRYCTTRKELLSVSPSRSFSKLNRTANQQGERMSSSESEDPGLMPYYEGKEPMTIMDIMVHGAPVPERCRGRGMVRNQDRAATPEEPLVALDEGV